MGSSPSKTHEAPNKAGQRELRKWTIEEVCQFVHNIGLTEAANILKANSVDGKTLSSPNFEEFLSIEIDEGGLGLTPKQKIRLQKEMQLHQ